MPDDQIYVGSTEQLQALSAALARFAETVSRAYAAAERAGAEAVQEAEADVVACASVAAMEAENLERATAAGDDTSACQRSLDNARSEVAGAQMQAQRISEVVSRALEQMRGAKYQAEHQIPKARAFLGRRVQALDEYFAAGANLPEGGGGA